ncbi:MAG: hypothetical protein GWN71_23020, partial [Gammaproteobacteria bacterium]|nr:hypothetical protein [Gemmatimonadota bacterium]NIU76326.1 hypothetical protein [Gammaproteobacteria bacterium]
LAVFAVVNIGLGLRSANAIIGLTDWAKGLDLLALLGVFTFWLLAFVRHEDGRPAGRGHLAVSVVSVLA